MRDVLRLGCALALGLAVAFPAGMMFAGRLQPAERGPVAASAERRRIFSPVIARDPYFVERQRENAASLQQHCRQTGQLCAEAAQMRAWLDSIDD